MLLAKIKEALNSLYEDIQEVPEAPAAAEAEVAAAETAPETETAPAPEAQAEEGEPAAGEGEAETEEAEEPAAAEILNRENFFIEAITGVDWIDDQQLEVVYDFNHFDALCRVVIRSRLDRSNPEIPTISHIYQGANWHERETHDFFGITFTGHPNLEPLLLPEDADFHPLLKDFKA